jgi:ABC-type phosphate transport system ATPase subunit
MNITDLVLQILYHHVFHQMQKEDRMQNKFHIYLNGNCTRLYKNNTIYKQYKEDNFQKYCTCNNIPMIRPCGSTTAV